MRSISIPDDVACEVVEGQAVLLQLSTGVYFLLDAVGTRMYELIGELGHVDQVGAAVAAEYPEIDPSLIARDLERLVGELAEHRLVVRA